MDKPTTSKHKKISILNIIYLLAFFALAIFIHTLINYIFVTITVNPSKHFAQANNAHRRNDISKITYAVQQYRNKTGSLPKGVASEPKEISKYGADICDDIISLMNEGIPADPRIKKGQPISNCNSPYKTGYAISVDSYGKITASALKAELDEDIFITR